jgi:hypothetical protein
MVQIYGDVTPRSAIPLVRYARLIGYSECAFFGVSRPDNMRSSCRQLWTQEQRDDILYYLAEAQDEIEAVIQYPLQPTWFVDERHPVKCTIITVWGKIIAAGIRAESVISDDAVVDLTGGMGLSFSVNTTHPTVTIIYDLGSIPLTELHVFYPDTDVEITPSDIDYDPLTHTLVITIPRCRLVEWSIRENDESGIEYTTDTNFQGTVDVHRIYNDPSVQGKLHYKGAPCTSFCTDSFDSVCEYIKNADIGAIQLDPSKNWSMCPHQYSYSEVNYQAGLLQLTRQAESAIIRLAHSKMPVEPCGCDVTQRLWARDRNIPAVMTRERVECPFGMSDGAWTAWKWACGMELVRASVL